MRLRKRKWMDPLLEENNDFVFEGENLKEGLNSLTKNNRILEIGSGKGGFITSMARKYPDYDFYGVELQRSALAIAVKNLNNERMNNLKFFLTDISKLFDELKDESFDYIFLNFSDPWPKKRQHKRRLTYPTFLKQYYRLLKNNGKLIFKTDNENLFIDSKEYLKESNFVALNFTDDYDGSDEFDAQTEYEQKFRKENIPIHRYIAQKKEN